MARPRIGASFDITLPSGAKGSICAHAQRLDDGRKPRDLGEAIAARAVTTELDLHALPLADANVIEGILAAVGAIEAERAKLTCRNCEQPFEVDAAAALPLAPLLEPLGDEELDPEVDRAEWHELRTPFEVARRGRVDSFRLARRTFTDRLRLEDVLGRDVSKPLPFGAPLVRALGLDALGRGEEVIARSPIAIARALLALDGDQFDEAWDTICAAFDAQHWPPRLLAPVSCPKCGARHDVEPVPRPLDVSAPPPRRDAGEFPGVEDFRERAARIMLEVFTELGVPNPRGLEVLVDDGVPPCDDGGEPLLGAYTPNLEADGDVTRQTSQFVIELFYRTFRAQHDDEPYDVDAEIRETIEHELEHHLNFLEGDDPLDEEERRAIEVERRRVLGGSDVTDLADRAEHVGSDFARFMRRFWPVWLVILIALLIVLAGGR